jgi:hypothetical protein
MNEPKPPNFLINALLQQGGDEAAEDLNRFSGFPLATESHTLSETAKAVELPMPDFGASLKRGVNQRYLHILDA